VNHLDRSGRSGLTGGGSGTGVGFEKVKDNRGKGGGVGWGKWGGYGGLEWG
jgi:hypothetical protein